jgi:2'-5' RNA ligase
MRLFVGIPLAAEVVAELSAVAARLRRREDGLRWAEPDSWHITLQFLGHAAAESYPCLLARLGEVRAEPVRVRVEGLDCFDRAGIIFAGVGLSDELVALAQRVTAASGQCGFAAEKRPYHPHITLARSKGQGRGQGLDALKARIERQPTFTRFVAREFLLYESHLLPGGARYEVRARFALGRTGPAREPIRDERG